MYCNITSSKKLHFVLWLSVSLLSACASMNSNSRSMYTTSKARHTAQQLNELLAQSEKTANIGIQIVSLATGKTVYEKNADKLFTPASSIKIMTAAAALHYLGPEFRYRTYVVTEGQKAAHTVNDLYLVGSGDPTLTSGQLSTLAETIYQRGVRTVTGNIKVDSTVFDEVPYGPGWMWDDMQRYYSAPVSGINVDTNAIHFFVAPGLDLKSKAIITQYPWSRYVHVQNEVVTSMNGNNLEADFGGKAALENGQKAIFKGSIAQSCTPKRYSVAIADPVMYAGIMFKEKLERLGIKVKGKVLVEKAPENAKKLAYIDSMQLSEILLDLTKVSNDHGFECILKTIGARVTNGQGTFASGISAMNKFLTLQVGFPEKSFTYGDGSGLSRYSLLSPNHYIKLLKYAYHDFAMGPEFMITLPIAGADGTLTTRMRNSKTTKQVRAKTGGMTGITSLAGYLQTENNEMLAFSIMVNGAAAGTAAYRNLQDKILAIVYGNQNEVG